MSLRHPVISLRQSDQRRDLLASDAHLVVGLFRCYGHFYSHKSIISFPFLELISYHQMQISSWVSFHVIYICIFINQSFPFLFRTNLLSSDANFVVSLFSYITYVSVFINQSFRFLPHN